MRKEVDVACVGMACGKPLRGGVAVFIRPDEDRRSIPVFEFREFGLAYLHSFLISAGESWPDLIDHESADFGVGLETVQIGSLKQPISIEAQVQCGEVDRVPVILEKPREKSFFPNLPCPELVEIHTPLPLPNHIWLAQQLA